MRLFTAIDLPSPVLLRLERLLGALRPEASIAWSPLDNLHITTKFIGEWPEPRLGEITSALAGIGNSGPFPVELANLGWFPNAHAPKVLYLGVQGGSALHDLAERTAERLERLGIRGEGRDYTPHLTLGRVRHPVPLNRLRQRVTASQAVRLGTISVSGFALFRSDPGSNASLYRKLHDFRLETALAAS